MKEKDGFVCRILEIDSCMKLVRSLVLGECCFVINSLGCPLLILFCGTAATLQFYDGRRRGSGFEASAGI